MRFAVTTWPIPLLAVASITDARTLLKRDSDQPCPLREGTTTALFAPGGGEKWTTQCPAPSKFKKDSSGDCGPRNPERECVAYCEEWTAWFYGKEIKYDLSPCHADSKCALALTDTTTVTNAYTLNLGIKGIKDAAEALNIGFSYQYSVANAKSKALTQTASDGYCGYWTFLPYYWASYGTLSGQKRESWYVPGTASGGMGRWMEKCSGKPVTEKVYNYKPVVGKDGTAYGESVFVKTNCETGKRLCGKFQKPSYLLQAQPDSNDYTKGWRYTDDADCASTAGSDGAAPVSSATTKSAAPAPTGGVGKVCKNNGECDAGMICNSGRCAVNPFDPSHARSP